MLQDVEPTGKNDFLKRLSMINSFKDGDFLRNKKVVVTGGCGFIGSHLVETLVRLECDVVVIDNLSSGNIENVRAVHNNIRLIRGDIGKPETIRTAGRFDMLFNEAATSLIPSFEDPLSDLTVNAGGTINLLEAVRKYDAKLIHASSGSIYGNPEKLPISEGHPINPISPYAVSKLAAESYCRLYFQLYDVSVTCLRYFNVYGPRQRVSEETGVIPIFVSRALLNEPFTIFGDGLQTRDFLHVSDCVQANLLAASSKNVKGESINIGGKGNGVSILDLTHLVMKLTGRKVQTIFKNVKPGDIRRLMADISKARTLLGYEPKVKLEDGLLDYIKYARAFCCKNS